MLHPRTTALRWSPTFSWLPTSSPPEASCRWSPWKIQGMHWRTRYCGYSNVINHPFLIVNIPPIKMVMNGGWFIIAIPTLLNCVDSFLSASMKQAPIRNPCWSNPWEPCSRNRSRGYTWISSRACKQRGQTFTTCETPFGAFLCR